MCFWQLESKRSQQPRLASACRRCWPEALAAWLSRHGDVLATGEEDRLVEVAGIEPVSGSLCFSQKHGSHSAPCCHMENTGASRRLR